MRIAISVDDHLDINKVDESELIPRQVELLVKQGVDLYLNAGDTYNDFGKTLAYFRRLQEALGTAAQVRFIAGNHDLVNGISYKRRNPPSIRCISMKSRSACRAARPS